MPVPGGQIVEDAAIAQFAAAGVSLRRGAELDDAGEWADLLAVLLGTPVKSAALLRSCVAFEEDERGKVVKKIAGYQQFKDEQNFA